MMDVDKLEAGRETDALVAERVMGWHILSWADETDGGYQLLDVDGKYKAKWDAPAGFKYELAPRHRWSPSTDIAAAWEVVEKLDSPDLFIALETGTCAGQHVWWCSFWDGDERHYSAAASTPALAICRAALKAVED